MDPIRESLSRKLSHRGSVSRTPSVHSVSTGAADGIGARKNAFTNSDAIIFCHQLSFGNTIDRPEDLKYWTGVLEKYNDDFSLLLMEMRRSRKVSSEEIFADLFPDININIVARHRPAALIASLFIHASGHFPSVEDVVDTLSACSVQRLRIDDVVGLVAQRSGADPKTLKKAIKPYLSLGEGLFMRVVSYVMNSNLPVKNSEALTDLISINQLVKTSTLSHDIGQMQSILINLTRIVSTIEPPRQI